MYSTNWTTEELQLAEFKSHVTNEGIAKMKISTAYERGRPGFKNTNLQTKCMVYIYTLQLT